MPPGRQLWRCPRCQRRFANRNQSHACGRHTLRAHFSGRARAIRAIYDAFVAALRELGPVTVLPEKTRIAFQVRMSFAQLTPRAKWVDGHFVLARRAEHQRFRRIDSLGPRSHVHFFRLRTVDDVDANLRRWMREAYAVGRKEHVRPRRATIA